MEPSLAAYDLSSDERALVEDVFLSLSNSCEEAYRKGVDSADIYKALQFHIKNQQRSESEASPNDHKLSLWTRIQGGIQFLRKLLWVIVLGSLTTIGVYWTLCDYLNVSPFTYLPFAFHELQDSRCLLPSNPIIMEMTRPIPNCSFCMNNPKTGSQIIEFHSRPTKAEFLEVGYSSKPIIIRDRRPPSRSYFSFETLRRIFESEPGGLESVSDECQFLPFRSSFKSLHEVFQAPNWEEPWYIGWSNCHPGVVGKLRKLFPRPEFLPEDSESSAIDWIFIGSPGHGAAMHLDYVRRPSWQTQLSGEKQWTLRPPPECEAECPESTSFTIRTGDMLFLDTNSWYHETYIQGNDLSISIGSEYD